MIEIEIRRVQVKYTFWILLAALLVLAACGRQEAVVESEAVAGEPSTTEMGGLDPLTRLALGTLELEGTGDAVSVEQAAELLPLWKLLQSDTLQGEAENAAIVKQIEGKMAAEQLAAIDGMGLTVEAMRAWMESSAAQALGLAMGAPNGGAGAPGAPGGQGAPEPGALQNLSEEERAKMREEFSSMSAEERATRMAEMGGQPPDGGPPEGGEMGARPGGAGRQANVLLEPLVELLTERAAG
jgi:hypothetical protein